MNSRFYFRSYRQPRPSHNDEQQENNDSNNMDQKSEHMDDQSSSSDDEWYFPDQQQIIEFFQQQQQQQQQRRQQNNKFCETAKDAWLALIQHKKNSGTADWSPGKNIVEFLLFCLFYDPTKVSQDKFCKILLIYYGLCKIMECSMLLNCL